MSNIKLFESKQIRLVWNKEEQKLNRDKRSRFENEALMAKLNQGTNCTPVQIKPVKTKCMLINNKKGQVQIVPTLAVEYSKLWVLRYNVELGLGSKP